VATPEIPIEPLESGSVIAPSSIPSEAERHRSAFRPKLVAAFGVVYIVWGSTYLAIRIGVSSIPPFFMAGMRHLIAGVILLPIALWRTKERPTRQNWIAALCVGGLLLLCGNGAVSWSEQFVPSGITALLVATVSLWMVIVEWVRPGGTRPGGRVVAGLVFGFGGVVLLVAPWQRTGRVNLAGATILLLGSLCWASGSVFARHLRLPRSMLLATAMECVCGGSLLFFAGTITGEGARFHLSEVPLRGWLAVLYLAFFGSLVGLSAYTWLLHHAPPARVGTYAFVNPLVALLLGWTFAGEHFTPRVVLATAIIVGSVIAIITARRSAPSQEEALPNPAAE